VKNVQEAYGGTQEVDIGRKQTTRHDKEYRVHQVSQPSIDPFAPRRPARILYLNGNEIITIDK